MIELKNIEVRKNGRTILSVPDLHIARNEILSIIGPNGSGKTTLLQTLSLTTKNVSGDIFFNDRLVERKNGLLLLRRRIAMVFQEPLLFHMSVYNNIAAGLKFRKEKKAAIKEKVNIWMENLGIIHLQNRHADHLSLGEAQRVNLARALVLEPELLLMDEPFSSLDAPTRERLLYDLDHILHKNSVTTLFTTHDRNDALQLGERIGVLIDGKIMQLDEPAKIFALPVNEAVAKFVGTENILHGKVISSEKGLQVLEVNGIRLTASVNDIPDHQEVHVCLRPENITIFSPEDSETRSGSRNRIDGIVERIIPYGNLYKLLLNCGFPLVAYITAQSISELQLSAGSCVIASFKATAIHLIKRS